MTWKDLPLVRVYVLGFAPQEEFHKTRGQDTQKRFHMHPRYQNLRTAV